MQESLGIWFAVVHSLCFCDFLRGAIMKRFEYQITSYPAEAFQELIFVCSNQGECKQDRVLGDQSRILAGQLNQSGQEGWELVQLSFGQPGIVAFWKRELEE